jgi:hypothetical protein
MTYFSKESDYQKDGILNPESRFMISANHITYYIAQFLIAICILFIWIMIYFKKRGGLNNEKEFW